MKITNTFPLFTSINYWKYIIYDRKTLETFFTGLGILWVIVSITDYFFSTQPITGWLFFSLTFLYVLWARQPQNFIIERLNGRDLEIKIIIGNIFEIPGARIISTNTTFDTRFGNVIAKDSLQGQFTIKYYNDISHLDYDLNKALEKIEHEEVSELKVEKKKYPIGTIAKLRAKEENFYLVAIAHLNEHGATQTTFEDVKDCLVKIWKYIEDAGNMEPLVIPLIGSGRCRLTQTRNVLVKEIIKSFIAACSTRKLCEKLTIVISHYDYKNHNIDLHELGEYLRLQCKYTEFRNDELGGGTGIKD